MIRPVSADTVRPVSIVADLPATTPFVGPERLMRERGVDTIVRLGANESAFGPSPKAVAAMSAELERLAWYGDPDSFELRKALAALHVCSVDEITVAAGIDDIMGLAVRAFVAPGGGAEPGGVAVTSRGTYPTFEYHVAGYGGVIERVDYRSDGTLDLDGLLARVRETNASLVYIANPDNPSGTFRSQNEIARFYEALPRNVVLFLDEAYVEFADEGDLLPPAFEDRLIRVRTFSKVYGLAGARVGYALLSQQNVETFQKIRLHFGVNRNAQVGALAALQDVAFKEYVIEETARGREEYYALADELGLPWLRSATNFVCIDLGNAERATKLVGELFERGVWIRKPGAPPLDRFVRVSVGTPPMREAFAVALRGILAESPA